MEEMRMDKCPICLNGPDECQHWFLANCNRCINPHNVNHEDIDPYWIAKSLSKICRFNGHVRHFYSVAQHSVYVSRLLPEELKFYGLIHDMTEAFCGDLVRPIKKVLPAFSEMEKGIWLKLCESFGVNPDTPDMVHWADNVMVVTERDQLLPKTDVQWVGLDIPLANIKIQKMYDEEAFTFFANEWNSLAKANGMKEMETR